MTTDRNPPCGLYRTTAPLPGREDKVPEGRLVYFHNHSEQGSPLLLLPAHNAANCWTFQERGYLVHDESYPATLTPLLKQGFYVLRRHLHAAQDRVVPERALVQLGYNAQGEPILFVPIYTDNTIAFPTTGYRFEELSILKDLDPAGFVLTAPPKRQDDEEPPRMLH